MGGGIFGRIAVVALSLATGPLAVAAPEYRVIPLGANQLPVALNDLGQTVGTVVRDKQLGEDFGKTSRRYEGYRTEPLSAFRKRDVLGPDDVKNVSSGFVDAVFGSNAADINDTGQVVGIRQGAGAHNGSYYAYRTDPQARIGDVSASFYLGHLNIGFVSSINAIGQFVGHGDGVGTNIGAFRSSANSEPDQLFPLDTFVAKTVPAIPKAINDVGQVVGYMRGGTREVAFRTQPNTEIDPIADDLGSLGGRKSQALGINNSGIAIGFSETTTPFQYHAFRSMPDSPMEDLGTLIGDSGTSAANAINDLGWIVGYSTFAAGDDHIHAVLWRDGEMIDLHNLVGLLPGPNGEPGLSGLGQALDITSSGIILAGGGTQYWLLVPVPEPSTWALLAIGLIAAPACARRIGQNVGDC